MDLARLRPMLPTERRLPFSDPDWAFELKYDGYRLLAGVDGGKVELRTKSGADATKWFPETVRALSGLRGQHVLDGEVCVLDDVGRPDFTRLHQRALSRRYKPGAPVVAYIVFDLLITAGLDVMGLSFVERKRRLAKLLEVPPDGVLALSYLERDGEWLFAQAAGNKLEGIVAKRLASTYVPGPSRDWLKIKPKGAIPPGRFRRSDSANEDHA